MAIKPVSGEVKSQDINDNLSYLDSKLNQVNGGPLGSLASESELNSKYPNGANGFFVIDGNMWFWENGKWVNKGVYQAKGIADGTVTNKKLAEKSVTIDKIADEAVGGTQIKENAVAPKNTNFIDVKLTNLFNQSQAKLNTAILSDGVITSSVGYVLSNKIPVETNQSYTSKYIGNRAYYDENDKLVKFEYWSEGKTTIAPNNAKYMLYTFDNTNNRYVDEMMVTGLTLPDNFMPYGQVIASFKNIEFDEDAWSYFPKVKVNVDEEQLINGSVTPNKTSFLEVVSENLFKSTEAQVGKSVDEKGVVVAMSGYALSNKIPVETNQPYTSKYMGNRAYYDDVDNLVKFELWSVGKTTIAPDGAKYMLYTFDNTNNRYVDEVCAKGTSIPPEIADGSTLVRFKNIKFDDDVEKNQKSKLNGLMWNALGDSITAGDNKYHSYIAERTGCVVTNYGIPSSTVSDYFKDMWDSNPMILRYQNMSDDADIISVLGGVNDSGMDRDIPMGDIDSEDTKTFYGAYNELLKGLRGKYPTKVIFTMTPLQANDKSRKVNEIRKAVIEVSEKWAIPCLDLYARSGLTPFLSEQQTIFMPDKLHPASIAHDKFLSHIIESFIESLI